MVIACAQCHDRRKNDKTVHRNVRFYFIKSLRAYLPMCHSIKRNICAGLDFQNIARLKLNFPVHFQILKTFWEKVFCGICSDGKELVPKGTDSRDEVLVLKRRSVYCQVLTRNLNIFVLNRYYYYFLLLYEDYYLNMFICILPLWCALNVHFRFWEWWEMFSEDFFLRNSVRNALLFFRNKFFFYKPRNENRGTSFVLWNERGTGRFLFWKKLIQRWNQEE